MGIGIVRFEFYGFVVICERIVDIGFISSRVTPRLL